MQGGRMATLVLVHLILDHKSIFKLLFDLTAPSTPPPPLLLLWWCTANTKNVKLNGVYYNAIILKSSHLISSTISEK